MYEYGATPFHSWPTVKICFTVWQLVSVLFMPSLHLKHFCSKCLFSSTRVHRMRWLTDCVPDQLPTIACNEPFTVEHALSCPKVAFPIHRHNEIWDITYSILTEVSHDVTSEPTLQALEGHTLRHASALTDKGTRVDIQAKGFWGTSH